VFTVAVPAYVTPGQYWLGVSNTIGTITGSARWDYTGDFNPLNGVGTSGQKNFGQYPSFTTWGLGDTAPFNNGQTGDPTQQISGFFMAQIVDTPEPTSLAILGASIAGFGLWRRRRAVT